MSQRAFQAALVRVVCDPVLAERVHEGDIAVLPGDLTPVERRRLVAAAGDPGMRITQTLHSGWRLGKLLTMAPLTCTLLGSERLALEARSFWRDHPPRSFYFRLEAVAFCEHVLARSRAGEVAVAHLEEVAGYERAALLLRRPQDEDGTPSPQEVPFEHDPWMLLDALTAGRPVEDVPARPCRLIGSVGSDGQVDWRVVPLQPGRASRTTGG